MQDSTMIQQSFLLFLPELAEVKEFVAIRSLTDRAIPAKEKKTLLTHVNIKHLTEITMSSRQ
jgi:hypothetical protein